MSDTLVWKLPGQPLRRVHGAPTAVRELFKLLVDAGIDSVSIASQADAQAPGPECGETRWTH